MTDKRNTDALTIARSERTTADGFRVAPKTLLNILKYKLANPLASQSLIAQMTGNSRETVSRAITTPYGRRTLESVSIDSMEALTGKIHEAQGDGVIYYGKSITKGITELDKTRPDSGVLVNARASADTVSKVTGLLQDRIRLTDDTRDALDYTEALTIDATIIEALEEQPNPKQALPSPTEQTSTASTAPLKGEGEVPEAPGSDVEETPTSSPEKSDE